MMLTTKGRYAVMAMVDIARHANGKTVTLSDVSVRQGITIAYLEQLFSRLKRAGLVKSVRGPGGGYLLARDSEQINVAEVILAADETIKMTRCETTGCSISGAKCLTHDLSQQIYGYLNAISLEDVLTGKCCVDEEAQEEVALSS